ncbi:baseplate J/gp47 family protein [uncultured Phascolarctobacterium sp.]|uniref:baseplate J/gp47 family protein n=1 Tax=uncultured Phascolarctobacterium sp. TaxID=512296 RepID=UPI0026150175|nr:baseplate J/gp47 family protein [uncultured Phascolarctobacterium sp.]
MNWRELIGIKSFSELIDDARLKLAAGDSKITNWTVGGVFRTLVEVCCWGLAQLYSLLLTVIPMGFLEYATGKWLDLKAVDVDAKRRIAVKTQGRVLFSRSGEIDDLNMVVVISAGSIVKTNILDDGKELRYFVTQEMILASGETSIAVPVEAEFAGSAYNVGDGYIRVLVTHIPGIDAVTNSVDWLTLEGADEESDQSLRERYKLRWHELSTGSTAKAYESWAYTIPGVIDVSVDDSHPRGDGTVDVIIASTKGAPTEALKQSVKDYIDTKRPECSDVQVLSPVLKTVDLDITLFLFPDRGESEVVKTAAETVIQKFFFYHDDDDAIEAQKIGDDYLNARLIRYLMAIQHVFNVRINSPAADVVVARSELATVGTININIERATET